MSDYQYVNSQYCVNACYGREVLVNGDRGIIIEDRGNYIGVNFDKDKPGKISNCQPTWQVEYYGIAMPRKLTRSQLRYKRYLEYGDGFNSFIEYVRWDSSPERSWN